jgi:hypothetical protein
MLALTLYALARRGCDRKIEIYFVVVAKLRQIKAELRRRMHDPVASVGEWLKRVTLGYYNYYAVPGNIDRLNVFAQRLGV